MQTIDIHAHWYPAEWLRLFGKDGPKEGASLEHGPKGYVIRTERITNAFDDEFVSLDLRLQGMRRQGVDMHALSLTAPMVSTGWRYIVQPSSSVLAYTSQKRFSSRSAPLMLVAT